MNFNKIGLTDEERDIENAIDAHMDATKDKKQVFKLHLITFGVGWVLVMLSPNGSNWERLGVALFLGGMILLPIYLLLSHREFKKEIKAKQLVAVYMRKNAIPLYNEILEKFADVKDIHFHLNDNGSITVTDKRKKEATRGK